MSTDPTHWIALSPILVHCIQAEYFRTNGLGEKLVTFTALIIQLNVRFVFKFTGHRAIMLIIDVLKRKIKPKLK